MAKPEADELANVRLKFMLTFIEHPFALLTKE